MKLDIYIQNQFYEQIDLGPDAKNYSYPAIASQVNLDIKDGKVSFYDSSKSTDLRIVPVQE